ncbi:MAG TPA: hypothetical protein PLH94_04600 [Fimbriimonadaceae bacterium]|nr:hypothetical protein [Fimbriimonadaceae bacterium]
MRNLGRFFLAVNALVLLALSCSCGGSGVPSERPALVVVARFEPYTGRDVPGYVGSLKITAQSGAEAPLGPFLIVRGEKPLRIEGVSPGKTYVLSIEGFQSTDGSGTKVASATLERTATDGTSAILVDMLDTEIARVDVSPSQVHLEPNQSQHFSFEAVNSAGATILEDGQDTGFAVSLSPAVGTFDRSTNTYTAPPYTDGQPPEVRLDVSIAGRTACATIIFGREPNLIVVLRWNADGRGLPGYASSARLTVSDQSGHPVDWGEQVSSRREAGAYTEYAEFYVPPGSYLLKVGAYATNDGTGPALGSQTMPVSTDELNAIDLDSSFFRGEAIRIVVRDPASGSALANAGLEMIEGQVLKVEPSLVDAAGDALVGPDGFATALMSGVAVSLAGRQLRALSIGESVLRCDLGDHPGSLTIPVVVKPRTVSCDIDWAALDSSAKSARILIEWPNGAQQTLVGKSGGSDRVSFDQPLVFGVTRRVLVQTYTSSNGTGPISREEHVGDFPGPIPPGLRVPRGP